MSHPRLRWHYGPTENDPDPGKMWCYRCDSEVFAFDEGYICSGCGQQEDPEQDEVAERIPGTDCMRSGDVNWSIKPGNRTSPSIDEHWNAPGNKPQGLIVYLAEARRREGNRGEAFEPVPSCEMATWVRKQMATDRTTYWYTVPEERLGAAFATGALTINDCRWIQLVRQMLDADHEFKLAILDAYESRHEDATLMLGPDCRRQREWAGLRLAVSILASTYQGRPGYRKKWEPDGK